MPQIGSFRIQRMVLKLLKYDLDLTFVSGSKLYTADLLSRNYCKDIVEDDDSLVEIVLEITHDVMARIEIYLLVSRERLN